MRLQSRAGPNKVATGEQVQESHKKRVDSLPEGLNRHEIGIGEQKRKLWKVAGLAMCWNYKLKSRQQEKNGRR